MDLNPRYESELYRPDGSPVRGHIELSRAGLSFQPREPGGASLIWPMSMELRMRLGGAQDNLIFFSHDEHPGLTLATEEELVLEHPALANHPELARVRRKKRWVGISLWVAAGVTLLLCTMVFALAVFFFV